MQFREFFLVLSTSSIIMLFGQSSSAFTLTQKAGPLTSKSKLPNGTGYTSLIALDPDQPFNLSKSNRFVSKIKRGGTDSFLTTLRTTYNATGWTFKKGKDLTGGFPENSWSNPSSYWLSSGQAQNDGQPVLRDYRYTLVKQPRHSNGSRGKLFGLINNWWGGVVLVFPLIVR
jgi:hypothetical protein